MLIRLPDWEQRLSALIADRLHAPLDYGVHDCCLWGADAVHAVTGEDFGAPYRGTYADMEGAAAALRAHGRGTITVTFDAALRRRHVALLRRGDVTMIGNGRAGSIGVVIGGEGLFVEEHGLMRVHRALWTRGWGVG